MEIAAKGSPIEKVQGIMYLLLLIVFPLLFLVSPYLAAIALVAGIAGMYSQRTKTSHHQAARRPPDPGV
jgi:hypothetical protein